MSDDVVAPPREIGFTRAAIGLAQGVALYFILHAKLPPLANAAILPVVVFVPLLVIQGWRAIAPRTLAIWAGIATACIVGLALYAEYRRGPAETAFYGIDAVPQQLWPALIAGLFISQALITAASAEKRRIASYQRNFEIASAQAIQVAASAAFTGALFLSLVLGAQLFKLINLKFLDELIGKEWFVIPVVTLAVSVALHVTDVRPGIIRGVRTLALTLLSWLLPLMTLLALGFVASLPFTGLEALWATRNATVILLGVAGALTVFINAAYQDGSAEQVNGVFRFAMPVAATLLVPLSILAAVALGLRVGQYGWTDDRVVAAACIVIATCVAIGYGWAVIATVRGKTAWLKSIETANVAAACVALVVLVALLTPLADPARIGTASQMARLESGRTPPEQFDFGYLRFGAERYGYAALQRLSEAADGNLKARAAVALAMVNRWERTRPSETDVAAQITMHPAGNALPANFVGWRWTDSERPWLPGCMRSRETRCEGVMVDLDGDGRQELLLQPNEPGRGVIFMQDASENWSVLGGFNADMPCTRVLEALRKGEIKPVATRVPDIEIAGTQIRLSPPPSPACTNGG